jgi:hypothetical protein
MRRTLLCLVSLGGLAAQGVNAQMDMGAQQMSTGGNQSIAGAISQPVTGESYQAEKVTHSKQTLSDGTVITHETKGLIARDAEGRVREDLYIVSSGQVNGREQDMNLQSAMVGDPVAHTMLIWTGEKTKTAVRVELPTLRTPPKMGGVVGGLMIAPPPPSPPTIGLHDAPPAVTRQAPSGSTHPQPDQIRTEELGQQSFEGILVTGKRTTTTIPLGKIGNDRPFVVMHEEWRSPELKILVKTIDTDPRTGEQTMELQGLVRTDPDEALFQAPAGYKVQDMAEMMKGLGEIGKPK